MRTIQRDIAGAFIFSSDGKLLLGKAGVYADYWVPPGGGVEEGESKLQALHREVLEETGIDISGAKITPFAKGLTGESEKTLRETGERVHVHMNFFSYKINLSRPAAEIAITTDDDFTDAQWFERSELATLDFPSPTITSLKELGCL